MRHKGIRLEKKSPLEQQSQNFLAPSFVEDYFPMDWRQGREACNLDPTHARFHSPPFIFSCAARILTGHSLIPIHGPEVGTPALEQSSSTFLGGKGGEGRKGRGRCMCTHAHVHPLLVQVGLRAPMMLA